MLHCIPIVAAHADAYLVALTRISGIVGGVFVMLLLSVIIFPKSASHQVQYRALAPACKREGAQPVHLFEFFWDSLKVSYSPGACRP